MASKSERELAASLAMAVGLERVMRELYQQKNRKLIWPLLDRLDKVSNSALEPVRSRLSSKDQKNIAARIQQMQERGFSADKSCKIYIVFSLTIISDRFDELKKANSPKTRLLRPVCDALTALYNYFDLRVKRPEYDTAAIEAVEIWYGLAA